MRPARRQAPDGQPKGYPRTPRQSSACRTCSAPSATTCLIFATSSSVHRELCLSRGGRARGSLFEVDPESDRGDRGTNGLRRGDQTLRLCARNLQPGEDRDWYLGIGPKQGAYRFLAEEVQRMLVDHRRGGNLEKDPGRICWYGTVTIPEPSPWAGRPARHVDADNTVAVRASVPARVHRVSRVP